MRVLLVCAAPKPGSAQLAGRLADQADITIGVDGGAALCREAGVWPDLLVGDLDSIDVDLVETLEAHGVDVRRFPAEKDATDLELAIRIARDAGADSIVITAATAGRLDHALGVLAALASASDLDPTVLEPDLSAWLLSPSGRVDLELCGAGATLSIVPFGGSARVSADGVRWPLEAADIVPEGTLGISNIITDSTAAHIRLHSGTVIVLSPRTDVPAAAQVADVSGQGETLY